MPPHRQASSSAILSITLVVGALTAAATSGALIAFGHRLGGIGYPFAAIAAGLLHRTISGSSVELVLAGLLVHLAIVFAWSALFIWLVVSRGWRVMPSAFVIGVGAHALSWIIAWWTGNGLASVLALGDRLVLAAIFAVALVVGIRFAFPLSQSSRKVRDFE